MICKCVHISLAAKRLAIFIYRAVFQMLSLSNQLG
jgi:hypothetical protein